ncbi:hypothetical protein OCU04_007684 [Sclerotinia nivalis]|uniref:Uncharacterized protein n=1 Tax=Sclerotinia nivalis TaxID=352851 RepID=A0A9X0DIN7_9HELO|nr:hypothetical protein OCU04_007684 [Sclerotinia nivalis]
MQDIKIGYLNTCAYSTAMDPPAHALRSAYLTHIIYHIISYYITSPVQYSSCSNLNKPTLSFAGNKGIYPTFRALRGTSLTATFTSGFPTYASIDITLEGLEE